MKLYGKNGRTFRCLWMLEEAGIEYQRELVDFDNGGSRTLEYLKVNPNGKIPALADGQLVLFESLAINHHIARTHAPRFWPESEADRSRADQWLAWAMGELEGPHDFANRTNSSIDKDRLEMSLNALEATLSRSAYLLGGQFTVTDLNIACVLLRPQYRSIARSDPRIGEWFRRCTRRPALEKAFLKTKS